MTVLIQSGTLSVGDVFFAGSVFGRVRSMHLKDWSPEKKYAVLFGEGAAPWKELLQAAETTGGAEFFLIEQEGSRYPELETAKLCLEGYRKLHG